MAVSNPLIALHHGPVAGLRDALRIATADAHAALDASLSDALTTRGDYVAFLRANRDAALATAAALARVGIADARIRVAAIESDLGELGAASDAERAAPVADAGTASDWGTAYVVEGSALGGRVLADALGARLALDDRALSFLRLRGEEAGRAWRAFVARLDAFGAHASDDEIARTVIAAHDAFALYARAFAVRGLGATA